MAHELSQSIFPQSPELPRLRPRQGAAIVAILAGATDGEAGKVARVRRETICRWRHSDPEFIAELTRRRLELWESQKDALRALLPRAVKAIGEAFEAESAATRLRAAGVVLKTLGVGVADREAPLAPGHEPTTADGVRAQWQSEADARQEASDIGALLGLQ